MRKRSLSIACAAVFLLAVCSFAAASETNPPLSGEARKTVKDETVYATLKSDGSVDGVSVVSHIDTAEDGIYTDKGSYDRITNLSGDEQPSVLNGQIAWQLPARNEGFYYQGTLKKAELPFIFAVTYALDGKTLPAEEIVGKSGKAEIRIKVSPNPKAAPYYRSNLLCQLQLPLSLETCSNILAPGASKVLAGKTEALAYMVLPGGSADFTVTFDTPGFAFDGLSVTCMSFDLEGLLGMNVSDIEGGVSSLSDGVSQVTGGLEKVRGGTAQLVGGVSAAAKGASQLSDGAAALRSGIQTYADGAAQTAAGAKTLSGGLSELSQNSGTLSGGYSELSDGISKLLDSMLDNIPLPQKAIYALQVEEVKKQLGILGQGVNSYTKGVSDAAAGMKTLSSGLDSLSKGGKELDTGAVGVSGGAKELSEGLSGAVASSAMLPAGLDQLISAQRQIEGGIGAFRSQIGGYLAPGAGAASDTPVSFVANNMAVRSIQFVITTPAVKPVEPAKEKPSEQAEKKGFFEKLADLFR